MKGAYTNVIAIAVLACGCATSDVNPPTAKAETGYVDFYADDASGLCWQIQRLQTDDGKSKIMFEEFKPRTNGTVRLAFAPGTYHFGIRFLNRAITEPGITELIVENGKITPVRVTLVETGKTIMETREVRVGGTFYGRSGRSTKLRASEGATFRVQAEPEQAVPYQPKERPLLSSAEH